MNLTCGTTDNKVTDSCRGHSKDSKQSSLCLNSTLPPSGEAVWHDGQYVYRTWKLHRLHLNFHIFVHCMLGWCWFLFSTANDSLYVVCNVCSYGCVSGCREVMHHYKNWFLNHFPGYVPLQKVLWYNSLKQCVSFRASLCSLQRQLYNTNKPYVSRTGVFHHY